MVDELKPESQETSPDEELEGQDLEPTSGVNEGNENPEGGNVSFTPEQQEKVNEIIRTRLNEEKQKFEREKQELLDSLKRPEQPQTTAPSQPDILSPIVNKIASEMEAQGKFVDRDVLEASLKAMGSILPQVVQNSYLTFKQADMKTSQALGDLEKKNPLIKKYRQDIIDYVNSTVPPHQRNKEAIELCAKQVLGSKLLEGDLPINPKSSSKSEIVGIEGVPSSTPVGKGKVKRPLTPEEQRYVDEGILTPEEIRGEVPIKVNYTKKGKK